MTQTSPPRPPVVASLPTKEGGMRRLPAVAVAFLLTMFA